MKRCTECNESKDLGEFYQDRQCKFGVKPKCKECTRNVDPRRRKRMYRERVLMLLGRADDWVRGPEIAGELKVKSSDIQSCLQQLDRKCEVVKQVRYVGDVPQAWYRVPKESDVDVVMRGKGWGW